MKLSVYIETSVVSYLTARPSRDLISASRQQITYDWWETRRNTFDLYTSELVLEEAQRGNIQASQARLAILNNISLIAMETEALKLADSFLREAVLPRKATEDALHIATSVTNGIDFLLTWNCKHIANATMRTKIEKICRLNGYEPSIICTPEELMEK